MAKEPTKAKSRKIKDLKVDGETGAKVKGGRDLVPDRDQVIRGVNSIARPKTRT